MIPKTPRRENITKAWVETLKHDPDGPAQVDWWDTTIKGFGVRVGAQAITFFVRHRVNGEITRTTLGRFPELSVKDARTKAGQALAVMAAGTNPNTKRVAKTLGDALKLHIGKMRRGENRRKKVCSERSVYTLEHDVRKHLGAWLDRPITDITRDVLRGIVDKIESSTKGRADADPRNPKGRACANRVCASLNALWNAAYDEGWLPAGCSARRLMATLKERANRVPDDQLPSWYAMVMSWGEVTNEGGIAHGSTVKRDLHLFSMFSAVRTDGLRHLRWTDVHEDTISIRVAKGGEEKSYEIIKTKTLADILARREAERATYSSARSECDPWVFPSLTSEEGFVFDARIRKSIYDEDGDLVRKESAKFGPQAYRKTYLSVAKDADIRLEDRRILANHARSTDVTEKHYTFTEDDINRLRPIVETVEDAMWKRIKPEPNKVKSKKRRERQMRAV